MDGGIAVTAVPAIAQIGADTWNGLARGDGFYLGYPWLAWAEIDPAFTTTYLIAWDAAGEPVGAVPTYLWHGCAVPSMNLAYSPGHLAAENAGRQLSAAEHRRFLPVLLVGSRAGYHGGVVLAARLSAAQRAQVLTALFHDIEVLAEQAEAASVAMLYVPVEHARECQAAWSRVVAEPAARPLLAPLSAEAVILREEVDAETGTIHPADRREWRRERRRYAAAVDRVAAASLSECVDLIAPLLGATQRKYGAPDTDADMLGYLADQVGALDTCSHVLLEYLGSEVVGFALSYLWDDGVYVRVAGSDQRAAPFSYFNLTMYRPLDLAAANGLMMINLGAGTYHAKRLRGGQPRFTAGLVRPPVGADPDLTRALTIAGPDYQEALRTWRPNGIANRSARRPAEG